MTASTVKSANITNIEAATRVALDKKVGVKKVQIDQIAVATTSIDEVADIILIGIVPSNAIILDVKLLCDDLDSDATPALAVDVGLYYSGDGTQAENGNDSGDAIDVDCFASAITTLQAAVVTPTSVRFEADNIVDIQKEAWDVGGLSADPGGNLYIGLKVTTEAATAAAGDIVMIVEYI